MLRAPTKVLTVLAGGHVDNLVAEQLTTLRATNLEAMLHPADLVLQGQEGDVVRARALLAERLAFSRAHLTWSKEGNQLEDRIRAVWRDVQAGSGEGAMGRLRGLEEELKRTEVAYEEWEVLNRALRLVHHLDARTEHTWLVHQLDGLQRIVAAPQTHAQQQSRNAFHSSPRRPRFGKSDKPLTCSRFE